MSPYFVAMVGEQRQQTNPVHHGGKEPVFQRHTFQMKIEGEEHLDIELWSKSDNWE